MPSSVYSTKHQTTLQQHIIISTHEVFTHDDDDDDDDDDDISNKIIEIFVSYGIQYSSVSNFLEE
jgi:hypothetical protein